MPFATDHRLVTIDHHIAEEEDLHPEATGDFSSLLHDILFAIRIIARDVRRAGLNDILGLAKKTNIHGEQVRKLDTYSNDVIKGALLKGGNVCVMASEENDDIILPEIGKCGKYVVAFDPLDGSNNIDANVTIGTIFSVYKRLDIKLDTLGTVEDLLQPGYKQVFAGYVLYGSSTNLVYTTGHGVNVFTYDPTLGEFLLTKRNLKIPSRGSIYSTNVGYFNKWHEWNQQYIEYLNEFSEDGTRPYSLRYIATGVADIHRTLHYGGIYLYYRDSHYKNGKLRLVYEANALAMIVEQAGGRAIDGERRILSIKPHSIHQRTPVIFGSEEDVNEAELFIKGIHPYQTGE